MCNNTEKDQQDSWWAQSFLNGVMLKVELNFYIRYSLFPTKLYVTRIYLVHWHRYSLDSFDTDIAGTDLTDLAG